MKILRNVVVEDNVESVCYFMHMFSNFLIIFFVDPVLHNEEFK